MIIIKLQGGLGNQLFQYAAGYSLAKRHNVDLRLDISWYERSHNRAYDLAPFSVSSQMATKEEVKRLKGGGIKLFRTTPSNVVAERSYEFDPEILKAGSDTYLEGYFQSERYFAEYTGDIRSQFTITSPAKGPNDTLLMEIEKMDAISLHVRRGDYVSNKTASSYHGLTPLEYYRQAVTTLVPKVVNPHIYVFSDDPEWTQENMTFDCPTTFVTHNGSAAHEDIRLMSACKHFIIANSTFSWWGAWLSPYAGKTVTAPKNWFAQAENDDKDLIPASWIRL